MKKILISLFLFVGIFMFGGFQTFAKCDFNPEDKNQNISTELNNCFDHDPDSKLVTTGDQNQLNNLDIADGFKTKINSWVQTLGSILAILAVGSIVYGSFLLVISGGEEEKLKKGKDVIKWGILGFLAVVFAGALISIVVSFMFSI